MRSSGCPVGWLVGWLEHIRWAKQKICFGIWRNTSSMNIGVEHIWWNMLMCFLGFATDASHSVTQKDSP